MKLNIPWLQSSNSKQYRDWANFLQRHGQIDVLSIDANIKTSWQNETINNNIDISGADVDTYNNSHIMNDSFISRKITVPQELMNSNDNITIKIQRVPKFILFWNYIKNFPIFSFTLFIWLLIIFLIFLWSIGEILFKVFLWIDIIWMALSILYFLQRFIRYMFSLFTVNYIMYEDIKVTFANKNDINLISADLIDWLKILLQDLEVSEILIYKNNIYIQQTNQIYPQDLLWLFDNLLSKRYKTESYKIDIITKTYAILTSENFRNIFIKK